MRSKLTSLMLLLALGACTQSAQRSATDVASAAPRQAQDAVLAASVKAKLIAVDVDAATNVRVSVDRGRVTLTGEARDERERGEYENAARSVNGVSGVTDETRVNRHLHGARETLSDASLAARVVAALAAQTGINALKIKATAHDGAVTLSGAVPTQALKSTILQTAQSVNGVRRVLDQIAVR